MKGPTRPGLFYGNNQIRLCPPTGGEEAAIPIADLPTGRTAGFTLQIIKINPDLHPFLRIEEVKGPRKRNRQAQVLTTSGVRKLLEYLQNSKPQARHKLSNEEAIAFIKGQLLPEMEAMETTVGRPKGRTTVGRPKGRTTVGRPKGRTAVTLPNHLGVSIAIKLGTISFSGDILDPDADTVSVTRGKFSRTWTASQLIEAMENHRF